MLTSEAGPGKMFVKLRKLSGVYYDDEGEIVSYNDYTPLICLWCTSIYAAVFLSFMPSKIVNLLAASGIAVLVDKVLTAEGK